MPTIFDKIIDGEIPSYKILEDDKHLAFLDIRPIRPGHTLCIPKKEIDYIFDLSDEELSELMCFSKKVAQKLDQALECERVGIMVAGLEVRHAHVHLVPMESIQDLSFAHAKDVPPKDLQDVHALITG